MKYIVVAFKARNSLYSFVRFLKANNIQANIINTPRSISTSCGLSAKVSFSAYGFLVKAIRNKEVTNLLGGYLVEKNGIQEKFEKIF